MERIRDWADVTGAHLRWQALARVTSVWRKIRSVAGMATMTVAFRLSILSMFLYQDTNQRLWSVALVVGFLLPVLKRLLPTALNAVEEIIFNTLY